VSQVDVFYAEATFWQTMPVHRNVSSAQVVLQGGESGITS